MPSQSALLLPLPPETQAQDATVDSQAAQAHSAALQRLEAQVHQTLQAARSIASELESQGRAKQGKTCLARQLGQIAGLRFELESLGEFEDVAKAQRARELHIWRAALAERLQQAESPLRSALELWKNRRSNALEWAIVLLIVIDIAIAL